jgi:hypothetical protein
VRQDLSALAILPVEQFMMGGQWLIVATEILKFWPVMTEAATQPEP